MAATAWLVLYVKSSSAYYYLALVAVALLTAWIVYRLLLRHPH